MEEVEKLKIKMKKIVLLVIIIVIIIAYFLYQDLSLSKKQEVVDVRKETELQNMKENDEMAEKETEENENYAGRIVLDNIEISLDSHRNDVENLLKTEKIPFEEFEDYIIIDSSLGVYFDNNICKRLSCINEMPYVMGKIHIGSTYEEMINQFGKEYEKTVYNHKGMYEVYRYFFGDNTLEFRMVEVDLQMIYGIEIYNSEISPIYDYGEIIDDFTNQ